MTCYDYLYKAKYKKNIIIKKIWVNPFNRRRRSPSSFFPSFFLCHVRSPTLTSRHFRQNVCWHGSTFDVVSKRSRHTEHSSKSLSVRSSIAANSSSRSTTAPPLHRTHTQKADEENLMTATTTTTTTYVFVVVYVLFLYSCLCCYTIPKRARSVVFMHA